MATNSSRFLVLGGEEVVPDHEDELEAAFAYKTEKQVDKNVCAQVDWKMIDNKANRKICRNYLDLPYIKTDARKNCSAKS